MASKRREQVARVAEKALAADEVRRFMAQETTTNTTGLRNKAMLLLMATSGLRVSEALGIMPRDIVRNGDTLTVRLPSTKAGVADAVPVNTEAGQLLLRWLDRRGALGLNGSVPVFCTVSEGERQGFGGRGRTTPGKPMSRQYVFALCKRLGEQAGIGRPVSPHCLRHTAGTLAYLATRDRLATRKLLRHGSDSVTEGYIAAAQLDTRAAVDALPRLTDEERPEPETLVDPMAAFVATLTPEQRAAFMAALAGERGRDAR